MTRAIPKNRASNGRRAQVLQVLRDAEEAMSIVQIAVELGVHPNTVRFHLGTLVKTGQAAQVETDHPAPGRPPLMFRVVRRMDPTGPRDYQLLAEILARSLADAPDPSARALEAGRAWAMTANGKTSGTPEDEQHPGADGSIRRLVGLLDDLGFAPEPSAAGIGLRNCPFVELAESYSDIVCPIHLGLMQGSLAAWSSPVAIERLDPFVEPDLCVAHLTNNKDPI